MADLAPKLNTSEAFNQPVPMPSGMEAIAGLFNFGLDVASKGRGSDSSMTQDEKFAVAVREFEGEKGATFNWDRKGVREFIFKYPQFTSQARSYAENLGVMIQAPEEVARDAGLEWFKTSEGMLAVAQSSNMPENEREAFLSEQLTRAKQQEAKLAELERNNAIYAAEGTLVTKQWDVLKPTSKDMVDNTVSAILAPLVNDVTNGLTVEVPEELRQMLGIRYDKVDMNNLSAVLADTKMFLGRQVRGTFNSNFGVDQLPPDDWNKEVFSSLDSLIAIGDSVKDPVGRASVTKALIETEMYRKLDENGVAVVTMLAEKVPAETLNRMIGTMAGFDKGFIGALAGDGRVFNSAGITSSVQDMSKSDAEKLANDTIQIFEHGIVPEFFTAFKDAQKRSGYNVVDGESYKKIVSGNVKEITRLVSENPDFRGEFGDWLTSDIQQTISTIRSNLPTTLDISIVNGKAVVSIKPESRKDLTEKFFSPYYVPLSSFSSVYARDWTSFNEQDYINNQLQSLPEGMNINTLNEKIAALGLIGEFGKEVQDAIGILNDSTSSEGNSKPTSKSKGGSSSSSSSSSSLVPDEKWIPIRNGIFQGESGGDYDALFGFSNRTGGKYSNVKLTEMTIDEALVFADPNGEYGNWVKGQIGRIATPMGAYQIVGTTLRAAKEGLGLSGDEIMTPELQDKLGQWIYLQQGTGAWEGYAGPRDSYTPLAGGGTAGAEARMAPEGTYRLSIDSSARGLPEGVQGASMASTEALRGNLINYDSPEVQQIVEKAQSAPEEAIAIAKEILNKPMDPSIKALVEALVRIGEKA